MAFETLVTIYLIIGLLIAFAISLREGLRVNEIIMLPVIVLCWAVLFPAMYIDKAMKAPKGKKFGDRYIIKPPKCGKK